MTRALLLPALLFLGPGCWSEEDVDQTCDSLCTLLVQECGYGAFPSRDSCTQGCLFSQEQGADVAAQLECIEEADGCDTFALAECEHAYSE